MAQVPASGGEILTALCARLNKKLPQKAQRNSLNVVGKFPGKLALPHPLRLAVFEAANHRENVPIFDRLIKGEKG
jgi:hypothetical protein